MSIAAPAVDTSATARTCTARTCTAGAGAWRRAFSFPVMVAALLAVLAVLSVRERFNDPDMWWHLKTGEIVWTTHTIPTSDTFSYTTHHHAWIPQEWLSQTAIYGAYRLGGESGLMLWLCLFTALLLIAGYGLCSLYSGNAKVGLAGALTIWFFGTVGLAIRPQLVGYLLLVLELLLIHLGRTRSPRWLLGLPPLFLVWVNCHGSFFLGLCLLAVFLFTSFFNFRIGSLVSVPWEPRQRRMLALALIVSAAAVFLNPAGVKQVFYPLDTMLHQTIQLSQVQEWQPLTLTSERGVGLIVVLAVIFLCPILLRSELFFDELLILCLGAWFAVSHQRMAFVFGILAAPTLTRLLATTWDNYESEQDHPWANAGLIALSFLVALSAFPSRKLLNSQIQAGNPVQAVAFIKSHHLSGNMLNSYLYGGYLIWAAPEHPVFLDGRGDVFEWAGVLKEYMEWTTFQVDPEAMLDKYNVNFCLLEKGSPMVRVLPLLHRWKTIYTDRTSVILLRAAPADLIEPAKTAEPGNPSD